MTNTILRGVNSLFDFLRWLSPNFWGNNYHGCFVSFVSFHPVRLEMSFPLMRTYTACMGWKVLRRNAAQLKQIDLTFCGIKPTKSYTLQSIAIKLVYQFYLMRVVFAALCDKYVATGCYFVFISKMDKRAIL